MFPLIIRKRYDPLPLVAAAIICTTAAWAFEPDDLTLDFGFQVRTHLRHSVDNRFPVPFSPGGVVLETVDGGSHLEMSVFSLDARGQYGDALTFRIRTDFYDIYDRNSTSDDKDIDVDETWMRIGTEDAGGATAGSDRGLYLKLGKFGKFERQDDRHLESYGLVATAFNRFEDLGLEFGLDLTPNIYIRGSVTSGNPVFMRDPNALAGDNGTSKINNPDLGSGFVLFYDAEVEDLAWSSEFMEGGLGIGFHLENESATRKIDVLLYGYERDLKPSADLLGTRYGGDLDLFAITTAEIPPPVLAADIVLNDLHGDYKREYGITLWLYLDDTTLFSQFVQQDIAGLDRKGWELELSHRFHLPPFASLRGTQLFSTLAPAIRYSILNPNFSGSVGPGYPAPSAWWEWDKIDVGCRLGVLPGVSLTVEYAFHDIKTPRGKLNNDEFLASLSWRYFF